MRDRKGRQKRETEREGRQKKRDREGRQRG